MWFLGNLVWYVYLQIGYKSNHWYLVYLLFMWNWKRLLHDAHFPPPLVRNAVSFTPRGSACSVWRSTWSSFPIRSRLSWPRRSRALRELFRDVGLEVHHLHTATVNKCPINVSTRDKEVFPIMPCEKDREGNRHFIQSVLCCCCIWPSPLIYCN